MKTIFILILLFVSYFASGQRYPTYDTHIPNDTIFVANQVATDSVYFKRFRSPIGIGILFDFTNVDAQDAEITYGYSPDGIILVPATSGNFTLDNTASANQCFRFGTSAYFDNVDTSYCKMFIEDNVNSKYIGYMFSKGSLTNDSIVIKYNR